MYQSLLTAFYKSPRKYIKNLYIQLMEATNYGSDLPKEKDYQHFVKEFNFNVPEMAKTYKDIIPKEYFATDYELWDSFSDEIQAIIYIKSIIPFMALSNENECIAKINSFKEKSGLDLRGIASTQIYQNWRVKLNEPCKKIGKIHVQPKRFGLRSFQHLARSKEFGINRGYCSKNFTQIQSQMNINFGTYFQDVYRSSLFSYVREKETNQYSEVGDYESLSGFQIADIIIDDENFVKIRPSWTIDNKDLCYNDFHSLGKPLFLKIIISGHIFCAFIFPYKSM